MILAFNSFYQHCFMDLLRVGEAPPPSDLSPESNAPPHVAHQLSVHLYRGEGEVIRGQEQQFSFLSFFKSFSNRQSVKTEDGVAAFQRAPTGHI